MLLQSEAEVDARDSVTMETPLHRAVARSMLDNVTSLAARACADVRDANGETALHKASACHNMAVWQSLLRMRGADVNAPDHSGQTALTRAHKMKNTVAMAMIQRHVNAAE